jgi:C4-dicarboxylate transporter, DcuC family
MVAAMITPRTPASSPSFASFGITFPPSRFDYLQYSWKSAPMELTLALFAENSLPTALLHRKTRSRGERGSFFPVRIPGKDGQLGDIRMEFAAIASIAIVIAAICLVARGWDVRMVLLIAAIAISVVAGLNAEPPDRYKALALVVREFLGTFSNEKFVVPICSAMGFAYVLRHTGCERHLVLLLVQPLRHVRWLLVPGVIAVGFLVNIPVISQTSTAVCIGPVVIPLLRAAGNSMATAGACLLLGASVGGELLNPGAPELLTVSAKTNISPAVLAHEYLPQPVFIQLAISMLVFWLLSIWWERKDKLGKLESTNAKEERAPTLSPVEVPTETRINLLKALVPLVPLGLLFAAGPPLERIEIPASWVVASKDGKHDPAYNTRLIGLAMLVGVAVAATVSPSRSRDCVKQFFEGAGYGFTHVVSLIVTANCFGKAIEAAGLAQSLGQWIAATPQLMQPFAAFVPLAFAAISGSGMASTQSLYGFFHDPAVALGLDPASVGAMVSLGSAAGRTMSPVSAVALMCATLTGTNSLTLAKRVAIPLLTGIVVVVILRMFVMG